MWGDRQLLALALASLAVGPALAWAWPGGRAWRAFLDGLSLVLVGGLCLLHLAPHAVAEGGLFAVAAGALGFLGPALLHRATGHGPRVWAALGSAAVLLHSALDGAALAVSEGRAVALVVSAHQLPVGLGLWTVTQRADGASRPLVAAGALAAVMAATVAGWAGAGALADALPETATGALDALVAGALLHVAFDAAGQHDHAPATRAPGPVRILAPVSSAHLSVRAVTGPVPVAVAHGHEHCRDHHHDHGHVSAAVRAWSSVGALLGVAALLALSLGGDRAMAHLGLSLRAFAAITLAGAPALLAGYLVAAALATASPAPSAPWLGLGGRAAQALRGVAFGLPLPVCACSVLPLYESLVLRGVPATAAVAFLVATPLLGPDALLVAVPLLGGPLAALRGAASVAGAVAVGLLVGHTVDAAARALRAEPVDPRPPLLERVRSGLRFGLVELVDHTLPWVVLGLLGASLVEPLVGHDLLRGVPEGLQVPLLASLGVPLYLSASAAIPVAALAVHKGVSAGAAFAFLLTGPAANLPTFAALERLHGRTVALRFGVAVAGLAILAGWAVDLLGVSVPSMPHEPVDVWGRPGALAAAVALAALGLASLFRQGVRGVVSQILAPIRSS